MMVPKEILLCGLILLTIPFNLAISSTKFCVVELSSSRNQDLNVIATIPCATASFGPPLVPKQSGSPVKMIMADPPNGCSNIKVSDHSDQFGLVIHRGDCSFETKIRNAESAGAKQVIVINTLDAVYTTPASLNSSRYNCKKSEGWSLVNTPPSGDSVSSSLCGSNWECQSGGCILTGAQSQGKYQICCAADPLISMGGDTVKSFSIPSVYVSLEYGAALEDLIQQTPGLNAQLFDEYESPWNLSMLCTWLLAVITIILGAFYSATRERLHSRQVVLANYGLGEQAHNGCYSPIDDGGDEPLRLTTYHALGFAIMGSAMLILLFYVNLLFFVNLMFMFCGILSVTALIMHPICIFLFPSSDELGCRLPWIGFLPLSMVLSFSPSIALAVWWFIERRNPYMWILQDLFGVCLCILFMDAIHISSLRVATILLIVAFFYDVFFVYLSPYVFGSNVMVTVASSGGTSKLTTREFCSIHPTDPSCVHSDSMPLVLRIPLINSYYGGYSMLGLGDIVMPGLLVSFALRYDYCKGYPISRNFFIIVCVAYGIGLLLANIMTVVLRNVVVGQPALMYLVPLTLGSFLLFAWKRDEFEELWHGPSCMDFTLNEEEDKRQMKQQNPEINETPQATVSTAV